ncbi:MAG TPA: tannase/feruloyl esterase family alpha/beta hydrolase [Vicinamibacterales bacterium]|nr:tannase/feruloyl esterase family alpha/beta hydrolase [Vicinamibacterales bacterium]
MFTRHRIVVAGSFLVAAALALAPGGIQFEPVTVSAQTVPDCAALTENTAAGLAGNPSVVSATAQIVTEITLAPEVVVPVTPHCQVDLVISERSGPDFGYAAGEAQRVGIRIGLPLNTADGGTGGGPNGQGAWNGRVRNTGGGNLVGSIGPTAVLAPVSQGAVGSFTDSGHQGGALDASFGVIQATNELNRGQVEDFYSESLRLQYEWALRLTNAYYGRPAFRNYFEGCSTGGRQALVVAQKYGDDFDGFLVGAPFAHQTRTSSTISWRVWLNLEMTGGTISTAKTNAAVARMIAECDGQDGLADGMLSNPRACRASAALNVCGQPGAPGAGTCLTPTEAEAIDMAFDGPRNDVGARVWLSNGRGAAASMAPVAPGPSNGAFGIFGWAKGDLNFNIRDLPLADWDDLHQLATTSVGPHLDLRSPDLDLVRGRGGKILMWHGLADPDMPWPQNGYYYDTVIDHYGGLENVTPWFRFFTAPGVNHCGGGIGPQPQGLFDVLTNWAENDVAPDTILSSSAPGRGMTGPPRTRPMCPYPQYAVWDGVGDPNTASSFSCGGNMHTTQSRCESLVVKYQQETTAKYESVGGVTAVSCGLQSAPVTTATLSPAAVNGWYVDPTVTLDSTDQDRDLDRIEYRLEGTGAWHVYAGPFAVSGDGAHLLEYRGIDRADNIETTRSLTFKIDATPPSFAGLPVVPCIVWPPNNSLVQVASITASDAWSGVAPATMRIRASSDEATADGDIVITGGKVALRARRSGSQDGRTYTIDATVDDVAGNRATASSTCTVPHDQSR